MDYEIIEVEHPITKEATEHVIIDRGNGEYTSMPKAVWDELEAAKDNGTIS
jgi:acyl-CoA thioesterase FadM